jgi:hypothetical protein
MLKCILILWLALCLSSPVFAKNPQIAVKELAATQKSWDGALLPALIRPISSCFTPVRQTRRSP